MKQSESHYHEIRGLRHHVRTWGAPRAPKLFLLHGWMDVSASFQFLVDSFTREWHVIAPDWRGFGLSGWTREGYWFPDYYGDLEALLDIYQPGAPADIVGHSMGGVVAGIYAGLRPSRVARLASCEGLGLARRPAEHAPMRYAEWLDGLKNPPRFRPYRSFAEVAARLQRDNPRLTADKAGFLARHWAKELDSGEVILVSDPHHKLANPYLFRIDEALACWRRVTARVLLVSGKQSSIPARMKDTPAQLAERKGAFHNHREVEIEDCGHMMHLDQPQRMAAVIEEFLEESAG
ncbi:MAG TPA: alpha/beta hydrolase [Burkholderiales bacterium]|nr:alpha/beta hydrolase [Burkholderiales bacterium]